MRICVLLCVFYLLSCLVGCTEQSDESLSNVPSETIVDTEYPDGIVPPTIPEENEPDEFVIPTYDEDFLISTDEEGNVILERYFGEGGDVVIPDNVTHIGKGAFDMILLSSWKDITITSVYIPDSVVSIAENAFQGNFKLDGSGLTEVRMSSSIIEIGESAFCDCQYLTSVILDEIPTHTVSIGDYAFAGCYALTRCDLLDCENVELGEDVYLECPAELLEDK